MSPVPRTWFRTAGAACCALLVAALPALPARAGAAVPVPGPVQGVTVPGAVEADTLMSYVVLTAPGQTGAARTAIAANGGTVHAVYDEIGVVVARSSVRNFAARMRATPGVQKAGATRTVALPAGIGVPDGPGGTAREVAAPAGTEAAETVGWSMKMIGADQAWSVTTGSDNVLVGVLDTGVDDTHPDLRDNFDAANSVSCVGGRADQTPGAWRPDTGGSGSNHGTHVAGIIAAAKNGIGTVGVAPGVRIASVRLSEGEQSMFYPENAVCGFMWAASHGFTLTNNSYYVDPWTFFCPGDLDQAAGMEAVRRAVAYAERRGVLHVAAAGNNDYDLAHKTTDDTSPGDSTPIKRALTQNCLDIPTELPGVLTVAAVGEHREKAWYSNFGRGVIDIAAPGGDQGGQDQGVYSTLPGGQYGYLQGTSMATPHVSGAAALLASKHPGATPAQLRSTLTGEATSLTCPSDRRCTGTAAANAFYGNGLVNALAAVE